MHTEAISYPSTTICIFPVIVSMQSTQIPRTQTLDHKQMFTHVTKEMGIMGRWMQYKSSTGSPDKEAKHNKIET